MSYTHYYSEAKMLHCSLHNAMGTQLDMLMVGSDKSHLEHIWSRVESRLIELELMMSRFSEKGELYRLNIESKQQRFYPSDELWSVLDSCFKYHKETSGYFDITLGYRSFVDVDSPAKSIALLDQSVMIDLGGYGKGYSLKEIGRIASDEGVKDMFVSFGNSSIMAMGHHPCSDCWSVTTKDPYSGRSLDSFELRDTTLTVSGNTPSHAAHIIDPFRGCFNRDRRIVSVVCDDPTIGEVLSTVGMLVSDAEFDKLTKLYRVRDRKRVEL